MQIILKQRFFCIFYANRRIELQAVKGKMKVQIAKSKLNMEFKLLRVPYHSCLTVAGCDVLLKVNLYSCILTLKALFYYYHAAVST